MDYLNDVIQDDELYHHGRKGMKWGQNIFGKEARTARKRKRALKKARVEKAKRKKISEQRRKDFEAGKIKLQDMTVSELQEYKSKLALQNDVADLKNARNAKTTSAGKTIVKDFMIKAVKAGLEEAGKQLIRDKVIDMGKKALGLDGKTADSAYDALKKEVDMLELNKRKTVVEDFYAKRANKQEQQSGKNQTQQSGKNQTQQGGNKSSDSKGGNKSNKANNSSAKKSTSSSTKSTRNAGKAASDTIVVAVFNEIRSAAETSAGRDYMDRASASPNSVLGLPAPKDEDKR